MELKIQRAFRKPEEHCVIGSSDSTEPRTDYLDSLYDICSSIPVVKRTFKLVIITWVNVPRVHLCHMQS
ncbi:UNVERIFIED_CONTAM: hypothetical protein NCL1_43511 [Trichonephila clavipes]